MLGILIACVVLLAVGFGPGVGHPIRALPSHSKDVIIPYAGRLSDDAGQPVAEGSYAFTSALYDTPTGGQPLWSEVQERVTMKGGSFAVSLGSITPILPAVLDGRSLWLAVGVRGPGEAGFAATLELARRGYTVEQIELFSRAPNWIVPCTFVACQWSLQMYGQCCRRQRGCTVLS